MSDLIEMENPFYEVPENETVLVKGKEYTGSRCKSGKLHTGWQLSGVHECGCKPTKVKEPKAPKSEKKKKGAK